MRGLSFFTYPIPHGQMVCAEDLFREGKDRTMQYKGKIADTNFDFRSRLEPVISSTQAL